MDSTVRNAEIVCAAVLLCGLLLAVLVYGQPVIVPANTQIDVGGVSYDVRMRDVVEAPLTDHGHLKFVYAASQMWCGNGDGAGMINVSAHLTPMQQAKALVHETVHIAQTCDQRTLPVDEKIAQDISDLLNSAEGPFVTKELGSR